jgi:hypothetical protein
MLKKLRHFLCAISWEGFTSSELEGSGNESSGGHEVGGGVVSNASHGGVLEKSGSISGGVIGGLSSGGVIGGLSGGGVIGSSLNWGSTASHSGVLTNGSNDAALVITFTVGVHSAGTVIGGLSSGGVIGGLSSGGVIGGLSSGGVVLGESEGSEGKDSRVFEHDVMKLRFDLYLIIIILLKKNLYKLILL